MNTTPNDVKLFKPGAPKREFNELRHVFPESHFERLLEEGFHFYHTTFWYPLERKPENIFESVACSQKTCASSAPVGTSMRCFLATCIMASSVECGVRSRPRSCASRWR